jgi:hypothetical protein
MYRHTACVSLLALTGAACVEASARLPSAARPEPARGTHEQVVPTRYDEDRFLARPVLAGGEALTLLLDTGGNEILFADVVDQLRLARREHVEDGQRWEVVAFPELAADQPLPLPQGPEHVVTVLPRSDDALGGGDLSGMLGAGWFRDRCWRLDYPARALSLLASCSLEGSGQHAIEVGFGDGLHYPRIQASVDETRLELLFDSGATTRLTPAALAALADGHAATRATSFIRHTRFEAWRARHPDWRVIEDAEAGTGQAMIEVPRVDVAGHAVGPVWFTRRPDAAFQTWMAQWMDRPLDGALGGSALRFFSVVLDYPHRRAAFTRP